MNTILRASEENDIFSNVNYSDVRSVYGDTSKYPIVQTHDKETASMKSIEYEKTECNGSAKCSRKKNTGKLSIFTLPLI